MTAGLKNTIKMMAMLGLSSALVHCGSGSKQADAPGGQWKDKMQEMSHVLVGIYPYLASQTEFNAPENRRKIQDDAERLATLAHNVNRQRSEDKIKKLDKDPFVAVISNTLDRELHLAVEGLRTGKRDYARAVLKECHFDVCALSFPGHLGAELC